MTDEEYDEICKENAKENEERLDKQNAGIDKVKEIFKELGIRIDIGACGCCESPWVKVEYKGDIILDGEERCGIYMFDD